MKFTTFVHSAQRNFERFQREIRELEQQIRHIQHSLDKETEEKYLTRSRKELAKTTAKLEKVQCSLDGLFYPPTTGNSDKFVAEYIRLCDKSIPKLEIDIRSSTSDYSLTTIPDLSKFEDLLELNLMGHENLRSGLERIPPTVTILNLFKANFRRCDEIARLTKLEKLSLQRNYDLTEIPDLSGMESLFTLNIAQTSIKHMPNLPEDLTLVYFPTTVHGITRLEKRAFLHPAELDTLQIDVHGGNSRKKHEIMQMFIRKVGQSNQFRKIREELLQKAAIIALNPKRIARLLESGLDFDDLEDRDNLFGMK
jgi:hypothetical protein